VAGEEQSVTSGRSRQKTPKRKNDKSRRQMAIQELNIKKKLRGKRGEENSEFTGETAQPTLKSLSWEWATINNPKRRFQNQPMSNPYTGPGRRDEKSATSRWLT